MEFNKKPAFNAEDRQFISLFSIVIGVIIFAIALKFSAGLLALFSAFVLFLKGIYGLAKNE